MFVFLTISLTLDEANMQEMANQEMDTSEILMKEIMENTFFNIAIFSSIVINGQIFEYNKSSFEQTTFQGEKFNVHFSEVNERGELIKYKVEINYKYKSSPRTRRLFVKKTPEVPEDVFNSINFPALFSNEIDGYSTIMPAILNFSKRKFSLPRYYYGDLQKCSATIVMEDFNSSGWQMSKESVNLSLEHALLSVKYLATFHGVGFALKHMEHEHFEILTGYLKESRYAAPELHPDWSHTLKTSVKRVVAVAQRYHPEVPIEFLEKFEHLIEDNYRYGKQRVQPVEPMATLCHGDFLRNNVAYKYEEGIDRPIDVMMFDLQTMRYSSPMVDLTVFLALSIYKDVRVKHFDEIFQTYCEELASTYVEHTQQQLPDHLSRDSLQREYVRFLPYSLGIAASFLMTLVEPNKVSIEQMLCMQRTLEEIEEDGMKRGGEIVDRELAHQVKEMYDMSLHYKVDISEGIQFN